MSHFNNGGLGLLRSWWESEWARGRKGGREWGLPQEARVQDFIFFLQLL